MADQQTLSSFVRDAVDKGATTAEEIHKAVASLPLNALEKLELFETSAKEVKEIQDLSIGAVYDLIREINHQVTDLAGADFDSAVRFSRRFQIVQA